MTKNMAAIFVAIMVLAQIGIAQHNTVHFTDHGHYEYSQKDHDGDHKKSASEACQICLLVKSLSFALAASHADTPVPALSGPYTLKSHNQITNKDQYGFYTPRAPPAFLI